jgi:hypothetical protein
MSFAINFLKHGIRSCTQCTTEMGITLNGCESKLNSAGGFILNPSNNE